MQHLVEVVYREARGLGLKSSSSGGRSDNADKARPAWLLWRSRALSTHLQLHLLSQMGAVKGRHEDNAEDPSPHPHDAAPEPAPVAIPLDDGSRRSSRSRSRSSSSSSPSSPSSSSNLARRHLHLARRQRRSFS